MYKFPDSPVIGQEHAEGQKTWRWNGFAWDILAVQNIQIEAVYASSREAKLAAAAALASQDAASSHMNAAMNSQISARDSEQEARAAAVVSQDSRLASETARRGAEAAAILTAADRTATGLKATEAANSATLAEASKATAVTSATNAATSATASAASATTATTKATEATTQAANALQSSNLASAYAVKMDGPVASGLYSAQYYANEAKRYVDTLIVGQVQANWNETDQTSKSFIFNKPTIATNNNQLTNGAAFVTLTQARAGFSVVSGGSYDPATGKLTITPGPQLATVASTGAYADLTGRPTIPSKTSELTNDAGFVKSADIVSGVASVSGRTGTVVLTKADVALSNVDNTSDANKPVSTAVMNALATKASFNNPNFTGMVSGVTALMVGLGNVENKSSSTIRSEITKANVENALSYTPLAMGGGPSQLTNLVRIGWSATNKLRLAIDTTDYGSSWPIDVTGSATQLNGQLPSYYLDSANHTGVTPMARGGTGSTTAAGARQNLGLNNVSNTADSAKPVSVLQQEAITLAQTTAQSAAQTYSDGKLSGVRNELKADIAGIPLPPTIEQLHALMLCW